MATITIKIESDELAREVLTQLGYLPEDDIPDLMSVEEEEEEEAPKTHVERMKAPLGFPEATRKMPEEPKQNTFCTTEDPKPDVEPVDNEMGAPLEVYSDEAKNERDELYKQCMEVSNSIPSAEARLKMTADQLTGDELLNYLDAMCDHDNKKMREAAKAMVRKEFAGHTITMWPNLKKVLEDS
jgi:hypothetical protein